MLSVRMQSEDENIESSPGGLHADTPSAVIMFVGKEQGAAREHGRKSECSVSGSGGYNACTRDDTKLHKDKNEKVRIEIPGMSMRPVEVALGLSSCARLVGSSNKRLVCLGVCSEVRDDADDAECEDSSANSKGTSVLHAIASTTSSRTREQNLHISNLQISGMADEEVGRACTHTDAGAHVTSPAFTTLEMEGDDTACLVSAVKSPSSSIVVYTFVICLLLPSALPVPCASVLLNVN